MAGLNFIWSRGAAGPGKATKEIDFVPHILSCSSWLASGWHGAVPCQVEPGCNILPYLYLPVWKMVLLLAGKEVERVKRVDGEHILFLMDLPE